MKLKYSIRITRQLADTVTPVGLYLHLRDKYRRTLLLESAEHQSRENSRSFICCDPLSELTVSDGKVRIDCGGSRESYSLTDLKKVIGDYLQMHIRTDGGEAPVDGVFGFTSYEAVGHFDPSLQFRDKPGADIPLIQYAFFRFIIGIDHFNSEMFVLENIPEGEESRMKYFLNTIQMHFLPEFNFRMTNEPASNLTDAEFRSMIQRGKEQCLKGNIFQVVLSRSFSVNFKGDEFNVYRSLRNINPSPFLFYYDGGDFRIFGSSPEAQLKVENSKATVYPIAGTFRRTGDRHKDQGLAEQLKSDPKERSEHMMLVDLGRNDLSTACDQVTVERLAEIEFYSHVIHMVSRVSGKIKKNKRSLDLFASTFPAGTLSGAPKHRAMQLIDSLESTRRGFYGGALGYFGFNGDINHCIIIRSFLSMNNQLHFRAGAGVVIASQESGELDEVNNKLSALNRALVQSQHLHAPSHNIHSSVISV